MKNRYGEEERLKKKEIILNRTNKQKRKKIMKKLGSN